MSSSGWRTKREVLSSVGSATKRCGIRQSVLTSRGADDKVFEAYQELLEQVASDAFDADASDDAGCIPVTKKALDPVGRSA